MTNSSWAIVKLKEQIFWEKTSDEHWLLNPLIRYVMSSEYTAQLGGRVSSWSDLKQSSLFKQLNGMTGQIRKNILVQRHLDRGIGDVLFTTGPLAWLHNRASGMANIFYYTLANKTAILHGNPGLYTNTCFAGPIQYDSMASYDSHWFIEAATEYDTEPDQLNVYDALFKQIGVDPETVDRKWKRPFIQLGPNDDKAFANFARMIYYDRQLDLRDKPFYVLAPIARSQLRVGRYGMWLELIKEISKTHPVIVVGEVENGLLPETDMTFPAFYQGVIELASKQANVINLIGAPPLRQMMSIINKSRGLISLDSGLLYVAQGLRVPAISIWGPHNPQVRIGYDEHYMKLAVWQKQACQFSPCFAHEGFPADKCPTGTEQRVCEVLKATEASDVLAKYEVLEKAMSRKL